MNSDVYLSLSELQIKFNFRPCQLKYYGVIAAVKQLSKSSNITNNSTNYHPFLTQFVQCKKASRLVYKTLVERKGQTPENSQEKWLLDFNNEPINWKLAYILPFQCTNSRKLIEFQFKLLHRQIPTNTFSMKMGLKDNEKCTFCEKVPEIIIHIFWSCDLVSSFWKRVTEWLQSINIINYRKPIISTEWLHWVWGQTNQNFPAQWICAVFWLIVTSGYANRKNPFRIWTTSCFSWNHNINWMQKVKPKKNGNLLQHIYSLWTEVSLVLDN